MKSKPFQLLILLFLFVISDASSQLSGYYTIGGLGANYQNLPDAIADLYSQGINGDVTFALNPGTYPGITFTNIPGVSEDNKFLLQSVNLDSTEVVIDGTVNFNLASYITIRSITLTSSQIHVIDFDKSNGIYVENCIINSTYPSYFYDGAIDIQHFVSDTAWSKITFSHSLIECTSTCIFTTGTYGRTSINNCEINSMEDLSLQGGNRITLNDNIFNGGLDIKTSNYCYLRRNEINGLSEIGQIDSIIDNVFISEEVLKVAADYFQGNYFYGFLLRDPNPGSNSNATFNDNYFECEIQISHANFPKMIGNTFMNDISLSFNKALLFENNKMYGTLNYGTVTSTYWNYRIHNNIFYNEYLLGGGHHSVISYNNFVDSAYLYVQYSDISVHDNNFCRGIQGNASPENINHNNYYPMIYCYYDTSSTHYDPGYLYSNPGIATNPLLQGKGWSDAPETDFLGNLRQNPPAIGANEIYICSDSMNNLINVPCGDELYINMCSLPDTGNYWWIPDSCIIYPDSCYSAITACADMTWYLNNSIFGLIDSVTIQVEPFEVQIAEMPLFYCGYARTLNASFHPFANYHWTPEYGLSNPYIRNPLLLIEDTTNLQYILECQIDGCGASYDTLNIDYDPLPNVGIYYPQQNSDTIFFTCSSTCVDEFLWDFGDGTFSNEESPYHIFPENGQYTLTLTGTNSFGSRSHTVNYNYYWEYEQQWAPIGATWYYEIVYPFSSKLSYIKYESIGDTNILSNSCRIITATEGTTGFGFLIGNSDTAYTYENDRKIYVYDPINSEFSLIYDFGATPGDSWTTTWDTCIYERLISGIDSIDINGFTVKTLTQGGYKIIESIGGERTLFHGLGKVSCGIADTVIIEEPFIQRLRCYQDDKIGFYQTGISPTCDYTVGIESIRKLDQINIFPNPAYDKIYFDGLPDKGRTEINISSLSGIDLIITEFCSEDGAIDISGLKSGIYLVQIKLETNVITKKIIVIH